MPCYEDNFATHGLITQEYIDQGARHINVRYHMIQPLHRLGIIDMRLCSTDEQQADLMTRPWTVPSFKQTYTPWALCPWHSSTPHLEVVDSQSSVEIEFGGRVLLSAYEFTGSPLPNNHTCNIDISIADQSPSLRRH